MHILSREVVKAQIRAMNSTFSSVRSKKMPHFFFMFRKHKLHFCGFNLIKYLIKTPQTHTRYFPVPATTGSYNVHFYNSNIILLYSRNQQYHMCQWIPSAYHLLLRVLSEQIGLSPQWDEQ